MKDEAPIRLIIFICFSLLLMTWEYFAPAYQQFKKRWKRRVINFGILFIDIIFLRIIFPSSAVGIAIWAQSKHFGLFNYLDFPPWIEMVISLLLFDLAIYGQHALFHFWSPMWRLHRVHHSDTAYDLSLAIRFHPLEILISLLIKAFLIIIIGPTALTVLVFEVILNSVALFHHSNIDLGKFDPILRWILVTPKMHRIHHSSHREETNSNFSFNLSIWDRLFRTHVQSAKEGDDNITIGIEIFREDKEESLWAILTQPFR